MHTKIRQAQITGELDYLYSTFHRHEVSPDIDLGYILFFLPITTLAYI